MTTPYPPAAPTISGDTLSLSVFLNNPARVQRVIQDLSAQRFIADRIFSGGPPADGGAVVYDQVTANDLFTARDVQEIQPNSEFPILNETEPNPLVALVKKWGGAATLSYEAVRRDRRDILRRNLIKLRNTIVRKVDTVALATLAAAPTQTQSASADWGTASTDIIGDIEIAKNKLDALDMGYVADTVLVNPAEALGVRINTGIRSSYPRENLNQNLLTGEAMDLRGVLGLTWFVSNRVTAGAPWVLDSTQLGSISDEIPGPYSRVLDQPERERWLIQAARVPTMYVTDPKAAVAITGA